MLQTAYFINILPRIATTYELAGKSKLKEIFKSIKSASTLICNEITATPKLLFVCMIMRIVGKIK